MRSRSLYYFTCLACLVMLCGCFQKKTNWNVSLDKKDKKPYGGYIAYESAKLFFPGAKTVDLSPGFRYSSIDDKMIYHKGGISLFVSLGLDYNITATELRRLVEYVQEGNELMIIARSLDSRLEKLLRCTVRDNGFEEVPLSPVINGKANERSLTMLPDTAQFGFFGRSLQASLVFNTDTANTDEGENGNEQKESTTDEVVEVSGPDTLGYVKGRPNVLRFAIGDGHITVHTAPLALSNYFLLQKGNRNYLQLLWNTLPPNITNVYWNDYYKRNTTQSDLSVLLKYPPIRWAFYIALFAMLIYLLFEGKRRQRIIPEIKPLENTSVSFVETVGRLYYSKGDHTNIGEKMVQHFLEWVRTHYFIQTNTFDARFADQLKTKSGLPDAVVSAMIELIREIHIERKPIDETDLYHLHNTIQQFYKSRSQ